MLRVVQINLHHSRAASAALCKLMEGIDIALVQEPWVVRGKVCGLGPKGELIYSRSSERPRTCIWIREGINSLRLTDHCLQDLTAVKIATKGRRPREIILGSAYLPYDDPTLPPTRALEDLVQKSRAEHRHLIVGCDANSHHEAWGSTGTNIRGESLYQFLMANNLDIMNRGNKPSFVTTTRQEVIDITIGTSFIGNFVKNWHVSDAESCSDHRYILFELSGLKPELEHYRNPRNTDWESYGTDLDCNLRDIGVGIHNTVELEMAAGLITDAVVSAYQNICTLKVKVPSRKVVWWN